MSMRFVRASMLAAWAFAAALVNAGLAQAQEPTPGAMAAAREFIEVKGATNMFDPVVPGVIETARATFVRGNPALAKDLGEVAATLRAEFAAKRNEIVTELARVFAMRFTEQELKDAVAFYKTALGKKLVAEEARSLEDGMTQVQAWAERFSEDVVTRMRAEMRKRGHAI